VPEDADFLQAAANTLWDAIERKRTENELREAHRQKEEFLALLGHELRNPLAAISTALQVTHMTQEPAAVSRCRAIVERQVEHLIRLVDDLLEMSRINRGTLRLKRKRVELADLIQGAVADTEHLFKDSKHSLSVAATKEPIFLYADPVRLVQAISNLVDNATKFTPEGGQIRLLVRRDGDGVCVTVRDDGAGIAKDKLTSIFEMFVGERPEQMGKSGLGIGLAVVKSLVEAHGGQVEVRSKGLGKGSEFTIRLPVAGVADAMESTSDYTEPQPAVGQRVLVVEDNTDTAYSLVQLLKLLGQETRVAYDGIDALEVAAEFRPHLVLLDIGLPKLNGYSVAQRIRQQSWGDKVCLVAVTGWGLESDRRKSKEAGFDRHMTKPLTLAALSHVLATVRTDDSRQQPATPD
jgi:CheY-like chemotaxis protein